MFKAATLQNVVSALVVRILKGHLTKIACFVIAYYCRISNDPV